MELCDNAEKLFKQEKSVLELKVRSLQQHVAHWQLQRAVPRQLYHGKH